MKIINHHDDYSILIDKLVDSIPCQGECFTCEDDFRIVIIQNERRYESIFHINRLRYDHFTYGHK